MEHIGRHLEKDRKEGFKFSDVNRWIVDKELEKWLLGEGIIEVDDNDQWRIGNGRPNRYPHSSEEDDVKEV